MSLIKKEFDKYDFMKTYKGTNKLFNEEIKYFKLFDKLLKNEPLQEHIKFANDALEIPPLKTYICYLRKYGSEEEKKIVNSTIEPQMRKNLGALFGYLYRFMYCTEDDLEQYKPKRGYFNDEKITGIKIASFFVLENKKNK